MHYPCCSKKIKVLVSNVVWEVLIRKRMSPEMFVCIHCTVWFRHLAFNGMEDKYRISSGVDSRFFMSCFHDRLRKNF